MPDKVELKVTIAKLIEVAYEKNAGLTAKIVRSKGGFKLSVDSTGSATLSGSAGNLTFRGDPVLNGLGARVKAASVIFSNGEGGNVHYTATFSFGGAASISLTGMFDVETLILSCSGFLCRAARALKGRHQGYEMELKRVMGG